MKTILEKVSKIGKMPPKVLIGRASQVLKKNARQHYIKYFPVKLSNNEFLASTGYKTMHGFLNRRLPLFFFDPTDKDKIVDKIKKEYPETIPATIETADEICNHIFDLLGSGKIKLGEEIDWHLDFKSGFSWSHNEYYLGTGKHVDIYLKRGIHADVKVPWELSRCQHFVTLGKAYWYTGNEKYAEEFVCEIESWIENNPVELGVNWVCTMDAAIRAVNWIWGYYFFHRSKKLKEEFRIKLFKSLFQHGNHIINNLEFGYIRGNHYLSDVVGLIYLGIFFQETKDGRKWLEKGLSALEVEMKFQVYPDGVDFEGSTCYHRLATELFLSTTLLCRKNNIVFSRWYMDRLEKMIEFVMHYTKPDGNAPQIGDNDDGRLHILSCYMNWDRLAHLYLVSAGSVLFGRPEFEAAAGRLHEEAFWLYGVGKFKEHKDSKNIPASRAFPAGGFYIMRNDNLYMIVDCVPSNPGAPSGHIHNSRLSFELFAYGRGFIIDPGTYVYTADKELRNLLRCTAYHNTVVVDGEEQNRLNEANFFEMKLEAIVKVNKWKVTEKYDYFEGEHSGYKRLKDPITHRRQIYFNKQKGYWIIKDTLTGRGAHKFESYLHFAQMELETDPVHPHVVRTKTKKGANLLVVPIETNNLSVEIIEGWISPSYGNKIKAPIVKYSRNTNTPAVFLNVLYPYEKYSEIGDVIEIVKNDLNKIKLQGMS